MTRVNVSPWRQFGFHVPGSAWSCGAKTSTARRSETKTRRRMVTSAFPSLRHEGVEQSLDPRELTVRHLRLDTRQPLPVLAKNLLDLAQLVADRRPHLGPLLVHVLAEQHVLTVAHEEPPHDARHDGQRSNRSPDDLLPFIQAEPPVLLPGRERRLRERPELPDGPDEEQPAGHEL